MNLTFKLYAGLSDYLPPDAEDNRFIVRVAPGETINGLMDRYHVPREMAHVVLLNGVYVKPEDRNQVFFNDGDTLAIWPPVAGG